MKTSFYNNIRKIIFYSFLVLTGFAFSCKKSSDSPSYTDSSTGSGSSTSQGYTVSMQGTAFSPSSITVPINSTVIWSNKDAMAHTVTSETGLFDSGTMASGANYSHQFTNAGAFPYKCTLHSGMTGTVIVIVR